MKKIILLVFMLASLSSCASRAPKTLILYYSQTGITETLANELQSQTGADICRFDVVQEYTGTYEETIARCIMEMQTGFVPELKPIDVDVTKYDVVFLAYPIWFGTYAPPVKALIASKVLDGKTVVPFCTFGSGGLQASAENLRTALPDSQIKDGFGIRAARIENASEELNRFLIENGLKKGHIEPLSTFSEQKEVSPEECEIFNAACSGYKYPIGTPVAAASRTIPGGTEYQFAVKGFTPAGKETSATVFITVADGKEPEFTQVVR